MLTIEDYPPPRWSFLMLGEQSFINKSTLCSKEDTSICVLKKFKYHILTVGASRLRASPVKILFMKESTEGVAEGQTTAEAGSKEDSQGNAGQESVRKTV